MGIQVPREYIISTGGADWRADYMGSGKRLLASADVLVTGEMEQYKVPEGTLVVAAPGRACVLVTASPDANTALGDQDPANYHLYRLTRLGQLQTPV